MTFYYFMLKSNKDLTQGIAMTEKRVNYLNNKDMLKEIHKSKMSYCYLIDETYGRYDIIVDNVEDTKNPEIIKQAKENRAAYLGAESYELAYKSWYESGKKSKDKPKQSDFKIDPYTIKREDLVFRVMTYEHIPQDNSRKAKPKTVADKHSKCNFPPFKHYATVENEFREVARSHWVGGLDNGYFSNDHGQITNKLAKMFIKLCERYSMRSNWRGYSYLDEMRSHALLQLSQIGLQFNEAKSQNPFAYYTAAVSNSFTRVLNLEKRNQSIRDDLLQDSGQMPSFSRQLEHEMSERTKWDESAASEQKDAGFNI